MNPMTNGNQSKKKDEFKQALLNARNSQKTIKAFNDNKATEKTAMPAWQQNLLVQQLLS